MVKHTKGPWKVDESSESDANGRVRAKISSIGAGVEVGHIAHVYAKGTLEEQEANAALIAAAPAMYEALKAFMDSLDDGAFGDSQCNTKQDCEILELARAALAAAKGE